MTNEQQKEPGFGRYRDKDCDGLGFWEHAPEGWRWFDHRNDERPGAWRTWEEMSYCLPLTPIEEIEESAESGDDYRAEDRRRASLGLAVRAAAAVGGATSGEILEAAREFEAYLKGKS